MAARALPDLIARIRVDSTGVEGAMTNLVSSFGRANFALAGVAAGLGVLVVGAKSMIDISEKLNSAELNLAQSVAEHNAQIGKKQTSYADVSKQVKAHNDALARLAALMHGVVIPATHLTIGQTDRLAAAQKRVNDTLILAVGRHGNLTSAAMAHANAITHLANLQREYGATVHGSSVHHLSLAAAQADVKRTAAELAAAIKAGIPIIDQTRINLIQYQNQIDSFIHSNKQYITDQSEVVKGYATLTRAGLSQIETQKDMNRSIDLAALKHISLTDAVNLVNAAEHGRMRGLIDLGITTAKYTDAQGNLIVGSKNAKKAMEELDAKTKGGRDTLTDFQKKTNVLNNDWQDLSKKGGPVLITLLDSVVTGVTAVYDWFDRIGKDNKLWATISARLVDMAKWIHDYLIAPMERFGNFLNTDQQKAASNLAGKIGPKGTIRAATGFEGMVMRPTLFLAGEGGAPEHVSITPRGGTSGSDADMSRVETLLREQNALLREIAAPPTGQTSVAAALYKAMQLAGVNRMRGMAGA